MDILRRRDARPAGDAEDQAQSSATVQMPASNTCACARHLRVSHSGADYRQPSDRVSVRGWLYRRGHARLPPVRKVWICAQIHGRCQCLPADVTRGGSNGGCLRLISFREINVQFSRMPNHSIMALCELYAHPILNTQREHYILYYKAQGWSKKLIHIKKAYILYKNTLFYYLLFFIYSIQYAEEILLLDNR